MTYREFKRQLNRFASFSVPNNRHLLDDPSQYIQPEVAISKPKASHKPWIFALSGSLGLILLALVLTFNFLPKTRITLDINPSLILTLNHYNRVMDVEGLNAEGDSLVLTLPQKNGSLSSVLESIQTTAVAELYAESLKSPLLFGIEGVSYQQETQIKNMIMDLFNAEDTPVLVVNQHSDETPDRLYRYAQIEAGILQPSSSTTGYFTTIAVTTAAPMFTSTQSDSNPSTSNYDTSTGDIGSEYVVNSSYSLTEYRSLAESLAITEAKLQLVLDIFQGYSDYQTYDDLLYLSQQPLITLFPLYQNLNHSN